MIGLALAAAGGVIVTSMMSHAVRTPPLRAAPRSLPVVKKPCTGAEPRGLRRVVVIVMENHDYADVATGSPFLDSLARRCGLATNYWAITHPSLPNYIAMTSGETTGFVGTDCTAGPGCVSRSPSIFEQVAAEWKGYAEGMTSNCARVDEASSRYAVRHNPAVYYTRIASECTRLDVPLEDSEKGLEHDLAQDTLPAFSFITPDLVDDEHDAPLEEGDAWLKTWVTKILRSDAYRSGSTALFVTYDEGGDYGGSTGPSHVYTVVASRSTRPGTRAHARFDHYSLLRTWEDLLGKACLGHACSATSMAHAFHLAQQGT